MAPSTSPTSRPKFVLVGVGEARPAAPGLGTGTPAFEWRARFALGPSHDEQRFLIHGPDADPDDGHGPVHHLRRARPDPGGFRRLDRARRGAARARGHGLLHLRLREAPRALPPAQPDGEPARRRGRAGATAGRTWRPRRACAGSSRTEGPRTTTRSTARAARCSAAAVEARWRLGQLDRRGRGRSRLRLARRGRAQHARRRRPHRPRRRPCSQSVRPSLSFALELHGDLRLGGLRAPGPALRGPRPAGGGDRRPAVRPAPRLRPSTRCSGTCASGTRSRRRSRRSWPCGWATGRRRSRSRTPPEPSSPALHLRRRGIFGGGLSGSSARPS